MYRALIVDGLCATWLSLWRNNWDCGKNHMSRHPLRFQRKRTLGWKKPEGSVCITRPGKFGNPFDNAAAFEAWLVHGEITLLCLNREWYPWTEVSKEREMILARLPDLRGQQLLCFCGIERDCHGDVLARLANE